jgi:uncharacterized OsmC-like protein
MMSNDQIREACERSARAVSLRPAIGRKTGRTSVRLQPGLACQITDGPWTLTASLGAGAGVTPVAPGPGALGRGALGSCLALGYAVWAARLGVELETVDVVVEADYDTRGELGVADDVPPGYTQVRYIVTIASRAPETDVQRVIDTADRYSPYLDVFTRAQPMRRELRLVAPTA